MSIFAAQAQNPHWQWYVEQQGGPVPAGGYIGFIRGQLPKVQPKAPDNLPVSRLFEGTGQAYLNTSLTNADESVQVVFKSSPFGTQSHGYESNNSFLLWAYGQRLLIYSGIRDIYGSDHHQNWMWTTRSTNCITINGQNQRKHTVQSPGPNHGLPHDARRWTPSSATRASPTSRRSSNSSGRSCSSSPT